MTAPQPFRWPIRLLADGTLTLRELEQRLAQSGKYNQEQIDRMLALVIRVREDVMRDPAIRKPS